ncbi:MAG TPA: peptidyl-prolyl cis-trans isomerase [Candidatus Babeliales bacterium]|nr:peptidyl-prolyl cis-trans isomerase [Candidatus Babeliales bacterium]
MKGHNTAMKNKILFALALSPLVLLSGCAPLDWIKEKLGLKKKQEMVLIEEGESLVGEGETLVSMAGKPIISAKSLDHEFDQLLEENPQLKSVLPLMPDAKYNFLQGLISQRVVDKFVEDNRIDEDPEYQKDLSRMLRSVKRMLNTKYFGLKHTIEVTDAEIEKFYNENKNTMPDLLVSRGGVKAAGVPFSREEEAKAFAAKAKGRDFTKAAKESGLESKLRDFKQVNSQSLGIDNAVKNKIVALKKFPTVEVVKGDDKNFWVVSATESQEASYRPFEQVKAGLKQFIEKEKRMAMFDKEIGKLKDEYHVVVNEDFFKPKENSQVAAAAQEEVPAQAPAPKAA